MYPVGSLILTPKRAIGEVESGWCDTPVWYTPEMVSKTSSVRSIRLPNTTWEWLEKQAAIEGIKLNALVVSMLDPGTLTVVGIKPVLPGPIAWPSGAALLPEHTEDPGPGAPRLQLGPTRAKPGDRAKKGKAK